MPMDIKMESGERNFWEEKSENIKYDKIAKRK